MAPITPVLGIQVEGAYMQKHSSLSDTQGGPYTATLQYEAFEVPVLLKITPKNSKGIYIIGGSGLSFTTKGKQVDQKSGSITIPDEDLKAEGKFASFQARNLNTGSNASTLVAHDRGFTLLGRYNFK